MTQAKRIDEMPEDLKPLWRNLLQDVGHRCQVVLVKTATIEDGTVISVRYDKRFASKFVYLVKTDSGLNVIKQSDSDCIKVFEEMDENFTPGGQLRRKPKPWTEEEGERQRAKYEVNVGRMIEWDREIISNYQRKVITERGRIMSLVVSYQECYVAYKVRLDTDTTGLSKNLRKKQADVPGLRIDKEYGEEGRRVNIEYQRRRKYVHRKKDPYERVLALEANVRVLEVDYEKAKTRLKEGIMMLKEAKEKLNETDNENAAGDNQG